MKITEIILKVIADKIKKEYSCEYEEEYQTITIEPFDQENTAYRINFIDVKKFTNCYIFVISIENNETLYIDLMMAKGLERTSSRLLKYNIKTQVNFNINSPLLTKQYLSYINSAITAIHRDHCNKKKNIPKVKFTSGN